MPIALHACRRIKSHRKIGEDFMYRAPKGSELLNLYPAGFF